MILFRPDFAFLQMYKGKKLASSTFKEFLFSFYIKQPAFFDSLSSSA